MDFLRGRRADWDGRWLRDIRAWDDIRLERDHHYIQWLFPLNTESEAVFAPMLREFEVEELRNDPALREQMIFSLCRMLAFYGFVLRTEDDQIAVLPSERQRERLGVWMTPENHNYLRISRILGSLRLAGLDEYAGAFLEALERLYKTPEGQAAIDGVAMWYWRGRASK
ncbi:MAG: opioid growth factor receptor-related protein [Pyrinomonadaceae bacterium]